MGGATLFGPTQPKGGSTSSLPSGLFTDGLQEPTGFENTTDSTISYVDLTRTVTIQPSGASYNVWIKGQKITITGALSLAHGNTEGMHYFYIDNTGALQTTTVFDIQTILQDNAFFTAIYWDLTAASHIYFAEERHGAVMDGTTHGYLHQTQGTKWLTGLALGSFSVDDAVPNDASGQFDCSNGRITDEDLEITIADGSPQDLTPIAQIPVYHKSGAAGDWNRDAATNFAAKRFGVSRLAYNQFTGGAWQQTIVTNGDFVLSHIFATNDFENQVICVQGENEYNNIPAAREGASEEINTIITEGLPFAEFTPLGTVIFQTSNAYAGSSILARIVSTDTGDDYVDFRGFGIASTGSVSNHSNLSGLGNDDHLQYALLAGRAGGQVLDGGTAASDTLELGSTSNATKGGVQIASDDYLEIATTTSATAGLIYQNSGRFIHSYGTRNLFMGNLSGNFTLTGTDCIGIGEDTLVSLTSGTNNFAGGRDALDALQGGSDCVALGVFSQTANVNSSNNTSVGTSTLRTTTGGNNTAVGFRAGRSTGAASDGVYLGHRAGEADTSSDKLHIANNETTSLIEGDFSIPNCKIHGDLRVDTDNTENDYANRHTERVTGITAWSTVQTLTPSATANVYTSGIIEIRVMGETTTQGRGTYQERWQFTIANAAPTVASIAAAETSGTNPTARLNMSGNAIQIQVQSSDGAAQFRGLVVIDIFAPEDYDQAITYTLA
jgi:hypothetical protein